MAEPLTALCDSFGLDDQHSADDEVSATNEAIKDRRAIRRLVDTGHLPAEQRPRAPRILTPIQTAADAPDDLRAAAEAALSMQSPAQED